MIVVVALSFIVSVEAEEKGMRPSFLLIVADDLGYEGLGCYGGRDFSTPRLDEMAGQGLRFTRAYTSGVCTPTRVSLHTGLYSTGHGHTGVLPVHRGTRDKVDFAAMPTFAQTFRAAGYRTSVTGKWQLATLEEHPGHIRDAGFDRWCVWQIWRTNPRTGAGEKTLRYWTPTFNHNGAIRDDIADRFGPDVLVEFVIHEMREASRTGEPFLIVHNEMLPHYPMVQTPEDRRASPSRPAGLGNMIGYLDQLVGRLLDAVEEMGIRDSTYVVFTADNGTEERFFLNPRSGEAGEGSHTRHTDSGPVNGGKHTVTDGGTHVPLIVWGPDDVPRGQICHDLVDVVDWFPTLCELGGVGVPEAASIGGISFARQVRGEKPIKARSWVHGSAGKSEAVFDGRWRLERGGRLVDARELPLEKEVVEMTAESREARGRLYAILDRLAGKMR